MVKVSEGVKSLWVANHPKTQPSKPPPKTKTNIDENIHKPVRSFFSPPCLPILCMDGLIYHGVLSDQLAAWKFPGGGRYENLGAACSWITQEKQRPTPQPVRTGSKMQRDRPPSAVGRCSFEEGTSHQAPDVSVATAGPHPRREGLAPARVCRRDQWGRKCIEIPGRHFAR
jgi:hypothetical protein